MKIETRAEILQRYRSRQQDVEDLYNIKVQYANTFKGMAMELILEEATKYKRKQTRFNRSCLNRDLKRVGEEPFTTGEFPAEDV